MQCKLLNSNIIHSFNGRFEVYTTFKLQWQVFVAYRMLLCCICIVVLFLTFGCYLAFKLNINWALHLKTSILSIKKRQKFIFIGPKLFFLGFKLLRLLLELQFQISFGYTTGKSSCKAHFSSSIRLNSK